MQWETLKTVLSAKLRQTAKRIFKRLHGEGGFRAARMLVKDMEHENRKVSYRWPICGEKRMWTLVTDAGRLRKVVFFVMLLTYRDTMFLKVYKRECKQTFWEACGSFRVLCQGAVAHIL